MSHFDMNPDRPDPRVRAAGQARLRPVRRRRYGRSVPGNYIIVGGVLLAVASVFLTPLMSSEARARRAVENIGLSDVRVESKSFAWGALSGCGQHDNMQFTVSGRDGRGQLRRLHVCATVPIGAYTIRS